MSSEAAATNTDSAPDQAQLAGKVNAFIDQFKSLQMASLNPKGDPEASYAPFIRRNHLFYIFISDMANHTRNLRHHPRLALFLIEDESTCRNLFARTRLSINATSAFIERNSGQWTEVMHEFKTTHGQTLELLMQLPDFHLVELAALEASFVTGFGKAFRISKEQMKQNPKHPSL